MTGTTRDVVEATLNIGGFPVVLSDTAGLRDTSDVIVKEGVNRARQRVDSADLILAVLDAAEVSQQTDQLPSILLGIVMPKEHPGAHPCILVLNKADLLQGEDQESLRVACAHLGLPPTCLLSCKTGEGIGPFLRTLADHLARLCGDPLVGSPSPTRARHQLGLTKCLEALGRFGQYRPVDLALAAEELRLARRQLGQLTGQVGAEEILTLIFQDFCIGK
ncbi:tRNA modification GTPase GTPBP3, mitochondrial-like [Sceloporus undulatus]|uniref:tRNA modification GTPase GTPBP3, mitochondrial-like n=1 Tax=Sceloporus undulatus TaxID=8520 RepID=UPI001C4D371A|nr:tRNA modification GTPase GTPBP3, mitochondrial-like [Sceloporus undulatus]